jgi:hypothetical protein
MKTLEYREVKELKACLEKIGSGTVFVTIADSGIFFINHKQ